MALTARISMSVKQTCVVHFQCVQIRLVVTNVRVRTVMPAMESIVLMSMNAPRDSIHVITMLPASMKLALTTANAISTILEMATHVNSKRKMSAQNSNVLQTNL